MRTLRLRGSGTGKGHGGEVFSCVYTANGAFVLSAGWDGHLRLWMADGAQVVSGLAASGKPLSCCALTPDGSAWVSGSMDGGLSWWDAVSHQLKQHFLAHIRPVSAVQYAPDGAMLATASWDRKLMIRQVGKEREGLSLNGHHDIVAGCQWFADGKQLMSWSHDGTLRFWDVESGREVGCLRGHTERVNAASLSLDGRWAVSGGRDGAIKVWDVHQRGLARSVQTNAEVRGCWCLFDGQSVATISADGRMALWSLPDLAMQAELASAVRPQCGALSPSGTEIALGGEEGQLHFIAIDGMEEVPIPVVPTPARKRSNGGFAGLLGRLGRQPAFQYICPICRHSAEIASLPQESIPCPACRRLLRVAPPVRQLHSW